MRVKKRYAITGAIILLLVIIRIALPYIVKDYVNKTLNDMPGYAGHVEDVDLAIYRGAYKIKGLVLDKTEKEERVPFMEISSIDLSVEWKALFKGAVTGEVTLEKPMLNFVATQEEPEKEPTDEAAHWSETVKELMPLTINRFEIIDGRINYLDYDTEPNVDIHLDSLQVLALNLTNTEDSVKALPSSITIFGRTIGGGILKGTMDLNALKEIPDFDLDIQLTQVDLTHLNDFVEAYGKFDIEKGSFSVFSEVKMIDGQLEGYVKPFFEDLKVLNWEEDKEEGGFFRAAWEAVVGLVKEVGENQPRDQVATQVPITGNVNQPDTDVWATITNTLKNAFIEAFNKGIEGTVEHG